MSTYTYGQYLSLSLTHGYYRDGRSRDWRVVPSAETSRLLTAHQFRWKPSPPGQATAGLIFGEMANTGFRTPLPANARLVFFLVLVNPGFLQFTDPSQCPGQQPLRWVNASGSDLLRLAQGPVPTELEGIYAEAKQIGAAGIVDLQDGIDQPLAGQSFTLAFGARATRWTYFVVLRGYNGGTLEVKDGLNLVQFQDVTADVLGGNGPATRERQHAQALAMRSPGARIAVFQAATPLQWQQAPRPKIALKYHGQDLEVLNENLPAPAGTDLMVVHATRKPFFEQSLIS